MFKKCLFLLIFLPQMAFAGFELQASYGTYKDNSALGMGQLELRVGHSFDFGLFLGAFYSLGSDKYIQHANQYFVGPMVGYQWRGIYTMAGYMLTGESDQASGGTKYGKNGGYQVTLGYRLMLIEDVFLGPELTYRNVSYDDIQVQGISSPSDRRDVTMIPAINLQFKF
jgi:hypothetical protein